MYNDDLRCYAMVPCCTTINVSAGMLVRNISPLCCPHKAHASLQTSIGRTQRNNRTGVTAVIIPSPVFPLCWPLVSDQVFQNIQLPPKLLQVHSRIVRAGMSLLHILEQRLQVKVQPSGLREQLHNRRHSRPKLSPLLCVMAALECVCYSSIAIARGKFDALVAVPYWCYSATRNTDLLILCVLVYPTAVRPLVTYWEFPQHYGLPARTMNVIPASERCTNSTRSQ